MELIQKNIIEKDSQKYIILDVINQGTRKYAFVNKITNDEKNVTTEYYIFTLDNNNKIILLENVKKINELLPIFQQNLEKLIQENIIN